MAVSAARRSEIAALEREIRRRAWLSDPPAWIEQRLGETTWSLQRRIALSVANNRRTAVPSCFASGKSWLAARLACWWIDCHLPGDAFVVTTATTGAQVRAILWREMGRAHAAGRLAGKMNQLDWWLPIPRKGGGTRDEIVAYGRKPNEFDKAAFQGIHARYVLVVIDEAAGIPRSLFEGAEGLITNADSRELAIGNPEDGASEFCEVCKPGSGWNVIRIDAFSTPNFTGEAVPPAVAQQLISPIWVEEKRAKWGEESPMWLAKVLAQFPEETGGGLIPIYTIRQAQERKLDPSAPSELGVDVGAGGDRTVIAWRRGPYVRVISRDRNPDTMQTCGKIARIMRETGASIAKVDEIGVGKGIVDRGKELNLPIVGVNVGQSARDSAAFVNLRAEAYWSLRDRFQDGDIDIDPDDEDLAAQLTNIRYSRISSGKILIESKAEMRRRNQPSPDDADAIMLSFATPTRGVVSPTWGRTPAGVSDIPISTWGRRFR